MRSKEDTLHELRSQAAKDLDGAHSVSGTMATASGVKDKFHSPFHEQVEEACRSFKKKGSEGPGAEGADNPVEGSDKDRLKQILQDLRACMPQGDKIFSPALSMQGAADFLSNSGIFTYPSRNRFGSKPRHSSRDSARCSPWICQVLLA
jgi:hypothetical protein